MLFKESLGCSVTTTEPVITSEPENSTTPKYVKSAFLNGNFPGNEVFDLVGFCFFFFHFFYFQ